jgi:hypothetical protein
MRVRGAGWGTESLDIAASGVSAFGVFPFETTVGGVGCVLSCTAWSTRELRGGLCHFTSCGHDAAFEEAFQHRLDSTSMARVGAFYGKAPVARRQVVAPEARLARREALVLVVKRSGEHWQVRMNDAAGLSMSGETRTAYPQGHWT